jgi:PrtD family type I secretion system ABC transporter
MNWLFASQLRPFVLFAAGASLLLNLALLMPALYMVQVFDRVFTSRSSETLAMLSVLVIAALAFGWCMDVARAKALAYAGRVLDAKLSPLVLRRALAQAALPERTGDLLSRGRADGDALRDVAQLRSFVGGSAVLALFDAPWLPVHLLVIGLMHPVLGGAATLGAAALVVLAVIAERVTRGDARRAQQASRAAQRQAQALLRNSEVIAGMGMSGHAVNTWRARFDALLVVQQRLAASSAHLGAAARIARQVLQAGLIGLGAWLVIGAEASPGIMVAATILLGRALAPVEQLIAGWKTLVDGRSAWQRLCEQHGAAPAEAPLALPAPQGRVDVERVVFGAAASRAPLLKGVSFTVEAGQSLGLIGPSASGKTTLIRLLLGIWRPQSGTVRLDGADIARWDRDALGPHVGYLPQDVELFAGTVAQNIARLAPDVDAEQVVAAAKLAHAHEMIVRLPQGYDTSIGEAGSVLSGGQRQRIALARAMYGQPRLVVLDEPNANLDAEGDVALLDALRELKARGVTVLMVSHRPALMAQLDRVAVLKDGALVLYGKPAEAVAQLVPGAHKALPLRDAQAMSA